MILLGPSVMVLEKAKNNTAKNTSTTHLFLVIAGQDYQFTATVGTAYIKLSAQALAVIPSDWPKPGKPMALLPTRLLMINFMPETGILSGC